MKKLFLLLMIGLFANRLSAQTGREISGIVKDTTGAFVIGANIKLESPLDTMSMRSSPQGAFVFKNVKSSQFTISVVSLGYSLFNQRFLYSDDRTPIQVNTIVLKPGANMLDEVVVNGTPAVTVKEDTIEYRVDDFKMREGAVVEDLVKKLDGVELSADGSVSKNGKAITRFRVNGKDFFGGDLQTAMKNIPVDAIDKIQIIDDYGDQANFTGVKEGEPEQIFNVTTRPGRNKGFIANTTDGGGSENRYQASLFASQFNGDRNIGITGGINNNGSAVGGAGFGGARGGAGAPVGAAGGFNGGNGAGRGGNAAETAGGGGNNGGGGGSGITTQSSIGLNYTDKLSPKISIVSAAQLNFRNTKTITSTFSEQANRLGTVFANSSTDAGNSNDAYNLSIRQLTYNINPKNLLQISGGISYSAADNTSSRSLLNTGVIVQDQFTTSGTTSNTPSFNSNVLYNHLYKKTGRNSSLSLNINNNQVNQENLSDNNIIYYNPTTGSILKDSINYRVNTTDNKTLGLTSNFVLNEPLSATGRLQLSYNLSYNKYDNSQLVEFKDLAENLQQIDSLSRIFNYSFAQHRIGLNYNYRTQKNQLSLGLTATPTFLIGQNESLNTHIDRKNFYLTPILRYVYSYSRTKTIQVQYNGQAREPQFAQLQPVRDVTNPQRPVVGNPNLDVQFTHSLNTTYNNSNPLRRTSFMLRLNGSILNNQIVNNIVLLPDVFGSYIRETRWVNTNGTYNYGANYSFSKSIKDRQYTFSFNGSASYDNAVSFADNIKNFQKSLTLSQGLRLNINPGSWMELTPNMNYSIRKIDYTLATNTDTEIETFTIRVNTSLYFMKNRSLIFSFDGGQSYIKGYTTANNTNPLVINSSLEKRFLKNQMASIKISAFDVFDQTNTVNRSISENGFSESITNRLTSYYMLTFTMRVNKFGGQTPAGAGFNRGQGPGGARQAPGRIGF